MAAIGTAGAWLAADDMASQKRFRADIQGLRAIAVLSVVAYHTSASVLPGGFAGVDIFFVISGYLITGILAGEMDRGEFSIANFYERRVRRLFPALFAMLAACFAAGAILMTPAEYQEFADTALATVFFVSNIAFHHLTDYFADLADFKPLLHTWSLAIEEQFYLVFPIALWLGRRFAPRLVLPALLAGIVVSLALCVWMTGHNRAAAFFITPYRAFELGVGAAAALLAQRSLIGGRFRDLFGWTGLALILGSLVLLNDASAFPGWLALLPCLGAALVILAGERRDTQVGRLLGLAPMVFFGNLSYSLYLWHWPVLAFARQAVDSQLDPALTVFAVALSIALAYASWRWLERPFLKMKTPSPASRPAWRRPALGAAAALMILAAGSAAALHAAHGLPQRFNAEALALFETRNDWNPQRGGCHAVQTEIPYQQSCVYGARGVQPTIAVWADSEGSELTDVLGEYLTQRGGAVMQITSSGCGPSPGFDPGDRPYCVRHNAAVIDALLKDARIKTVVMTAYYSAYWNRADFASGFAEAAQRLHAAGKKIVLVYPVPTFAFDPPAALGKEVARGLDPVAMGETRASYEHRNGPIIAWLDALAVRTGAAKLKPEDVLCDAALCHAFASGVGSLYANATHLGMSGERYVLSREPVDQLWGPT